MFPDIAEYKERITREREAAFGNPAGITNPFDQLNDFSNRLDAIFSQIFSVFITADSPDTHVSLVAVGGYGRQEMFPFSDADIIILHDYRKPPEKIERLVRFLWDLNISMGCVVRSLRDCKRILGKDVATDTAYLNHRLITGNERLYQSMINYAVVPHFRFHSDSFAAEMQAGMREGLFSGQDSIYKIEPNLKTGVCGLRDCQRVIWAEMARNGSYTWQELRSRSRFIASYGAQLRKLYSSLALMRIQLHRECGCRADILEMNYQGPVAARLGYGDAGAGILMEHYFQTVREIRRILLSYLEVVPGWENGLRSLVRFAGGNRIIHGAALFRDRLFPSDSALLLDPVQILKIFSAAIIHRAVLSVDLAERIRVSGAAIEASEFRTDEVGIVVRTMLANNAPIGQVFRQMHETGILAKLIPQFTDITCKVEYDSYHEFTVDEHILLSLVTSDEMDTDPEPKIRSLYKSLKRKMLLRAAILLHDIGKSMPGEHTVNGSVITETVCERLGFSEEESERIRFLVHEHLSLYNLSVLAEPDQAAIDEFCSRVEDRENLDMLYLLTIADVRSVGKKTWTAWKAFQLVRCYELARASLEGKPPVLHGLISYEHDVPVEDQEKHRQWLIELSNGSDIKLHVEAYHGFERLTVCGHDRLGFLSDIIGCVSSEGYNILAAKVYTLDVNKVLDIFYLEPPELPSINPDKRVANMYRKWDMVRAGTMNADGLIRERIQTYPPATLRSSHNRDIRVDIDNSSVLHATKITVDTPDNFGILHTIVQCLSELNINIVSARLATRADLASDVFYITGKDGKKISDENVLINLKERLIERLS